MSRSILTAVLVLALWPSAVRAQPEVVTFEDAVRIALEGNSTLARAENNLLLDRSAVSEARMQFLPDLSFSASASQNWGRSFSESEGRILSQSNQSVSAGLSSRVVLFNGFARMANLRAALLSLEAGGRDARRTRQTVVFLVISGYLSVIETDAQRQVAEENLAAERDQEVRVRELVDAGRSPISDLYQQQANVAQAEATLVSARRSVELARIDLVQTLQLDPVGEYVFDAPALPDSVIAWPEPEFGSALEDAFLNRADLQALESRVGASEAEEKTAAGGYWPSLTLSGSYRSSYSSESDRDLFQQFDDRRGGSVSLGLSFPIFDGFSTGRAVTRARIGTENTRIALADLRQTVALEVRRAVLDEVSASESLKAARAQLRAADRALEATQERYEAGASTLYEVTLSRAALVQARSARVNAAYTLLWQKNVRDYYVGTLDPETLEIPWTGASPGN